MPFFLLSFTCPNENELLGLRMVKAGAAAVAVSPVPLLIWAVTR